MVARDPARWVRPGIGVHGQIDNVDMERYHLIGMTLEECIVLEEITLMVNMNRLPPQFRYSFAIQ